MAHVRRKFTEAQTSHPAEAAKAVEYISLLYTLEENLRGRGASFEEVARERQAKAIPIMDAMEEWMKCASLKCGPSDPLGKALDYAYKLWPRLRRYALDGRYQIYNNLLALGKLRHSRSQPAAVADARTRVITDGLSRGRNYGHAAVQLQKISVVTPEIFLSRKSQRVSNGY